MSSLPQKNEEKKVEYIELVYDLIFVYIIGRNNLILHNTEVYPQSLLLFFDVISYCSSPVFMLRAVV